MTNQDTSAPGSDFISRLSTNKQHALAVITLMVLPVILFDASVLGGKKIIGQDIVQWRAGAESVIEYEETHEEDALWATNMFSGMPAYVISYEKTFFHIDQLIRKTFKSIFPAAHYWVLLIGVYLFFVLQGIRPLAAVLGSIFIGLTTYIPIIIGAGHNSKFLTYAYIPWLLSGYWILTKTDKRLLGFFTFTLAATMVLRASHPQVTYYFLYLLGFWWLFDSYNAYKEDRLKTWSVITGLLAGAGLLAIASNLQPYWSIYEYSPYTIRGGSALSGDSGLSLDYAFRWSQGVGELITLLIPGAYGGSSAQAYWGLKPGTSGPHYLGAIASVLAVIGIFLYRKKRKYLFLGTGILTMLFSLGYHFSLLNEFMFNYVPYFDKFRTPEMWLIVTIFCFTTLAVYGVHELVERVEAAAGVNTKKLYGILAVAIGVGVIFTFGSNAILSFENQRQRDMIAEQVARQNNLPEDSRQVQQYTSQYINTRLKPERKEMAQNDATRYLILVLLGSGLVVAFYKRKLGTGLFLSGLIIISAYDMISVGKRYLEEDSFVQEQITPARYVEAQKQPVDDYIMDHIKSDSGYPFRVFPLDYNPFNNAIPSYFYPTIGGYTGAKLSYYQDMIDQLLFTGQGLNFEILSMLNVKYITASRELPFPQLEEVFQANGQRVYRNREVLPKAFFVDSLVTVDRPGEALDRLNPSAGFDASRFAVVETTEPLGAETDSAASLQVTHYDARTITLKTDRSKPGFLVLNEIFYPKGWTASVDGEQTPIYKTNYILRGIEIPAGSHEITFRFDPVSHAWGSRITWAGNIVQLGIGVLLLVGYLRRRLTSDPDES